MLAIAMCHVCMSVIINVHRFRAEQPFHTLLLHDLIMDGDAVVAQEINNIFKKEERERKGGRYRHHMTGPPLRHQRDKLEKMSDTLKMCYKYTIEGIPQ